MRMSIRIGLLGAALAIGACTALDEDSVNANSQLQVRLTDAPGDYEGVYIDVEDIQVHRSGDDSVGETGWESLEGVRKGVYSLHELVNGKDTLIMDGSIPSGYIGHLRLVLGDGNRLESGDTSYQLSVSPAWESGLEIGQELSEGAVYTFLLDVDVARSVVPPAEEGEPYRLDPVVRVVESADQGGVIRGVVSPAGVNTAIRAVAGGDTLGTYADTLGNYMLKAVPAGTYSLEFLPGASSGLQQLDTADVSVNEGEVSQVNVTLGEPAGEGEEPGPGE